MNNRPKSDNIEKMKRIAQVQNWILDDLRTTDIVEKICKDYELSPRQALRYIKLAAAHFAKITEKNLEKRLYYHIQRRNKLLRDLDPDESKTPAGINAQLSVLKDIAELEKLYTLKIEVTGKEGKAVQTESVHRVVFESYAK